MLASQSGSLVAGLGNLWYPTVHPATSSMPNALAFIALLLWPLVVVVLFRRLPLERALIWSILGGYLILPPVAAIDLPAVPALDKMSIPALSAWLVVRFMLRIPVPLIPESRMGQALLALFVLAPFGTILTNPEAIAVVERAPLPGLRLYDAISIIAFQAFVILTFALARSLLATAAALREILIALVIGGLAYSLPMLIEVRLSPQLNIWIYGFFQHSFEQMMRQGGFRPIVFLAHGLWVAFFAMTALLAAVSLARSAPQADRTRLLLVSGYLFVVLVLCKSIGSLVYAVFLVPLVLFMGQRWLLRLSVAMAVLALTYPVLRSAGHIPAQEMVDFAARYSAERAHSLNYRFTNEAALLEHAFRKPWFGWGGYERNLLHDIWTGRVSTIADGRWVIVLGMFGWVGYVGEFGILALPLFLLWREGELRGAALLAAPVGALAVIHGINMVDMLPNATLTPLTWLIAGALLGHAESLARERRGDALRRRAAAFGGPQRTIL